MNYNDDLYIYILHPFSRCFIQSGLHMRNATFVNEGYQFFVFPSVVWYWKTSILMSYILMFFFHSHTWVYYKKEKVND